MGEILLDLAAAPHTTSGELDCLPLGELTTLAVDVNVTAVSGTTPTLDVFLERQGADGVWYQVWHPTQIIAVGQASTSVGPGAATPAVLTSKLRLRWAIGGTTPSFTFSASIWAR